MFKSKAAVKTPAPSASPAADAAKDQAAALQLGRAAWRLDPGAAVLPGTLKVGGAFGPREAEMLGAVVSAHPLRALRLCGLTFTAPMRALLLAALPSCSTLATLYLVDIGLGPADGPDLWAALAKAAGPGEPSRPASREDRDSGGGTRAKAVLSGSLEVLDVRSNGLGAEGLAGLGACLARQQRLLSLDLSGNSLGDAGIEALLAGLRPPLRPPTATQTSRPTTPAATPAKGTVGGAAGGQQSRGRAAAKTHAAAAKAARATSPVSAAAAASGATGPAGAALAGAAAAAESAAAAALATEGSARWPLGLWLEELRLASNGVSEVGLGALLAVLCHSQALPRLRKCGVASNPFPARAASYGARAMLAARRKDRLRVDPEAAAKPVVIIDPVEVSAA